MLLGSKLSMLLKGQGDLKDLYLLGAAQGRRPMSPASLLHANPQGVSGGVAGVPARAQPSPAAPSRRLCAVPHPFSGWTVMARGLSSPWEITT